ncbi:hypothetical protein [Nocardioides sp. B-3]|uniref:hypothetical protein n=1 Tax=Nocardioides sp. B-3 TaxID=2895565 RepID=UPI002152B9B9|nr:hypothetical protein [Nocardioides sp. B-3]UUZ60212.1 hypothetical protein LP418_04540 [Nocardioides sp. B-3]
MTWLHGRRVDDPINAYIARTVADAHPDADQIRKAERHAYTAYNRAEQARTRLDEIIYAELRPYGQTAHTRDTTGRLDVVADELAGVERDLRAASARVRALASEPSIRTLPDEGLDGEHDRWTADRLARRQAATQGSQRPQTAPTREATADRPASSEPEHSRPRAGHRPLKLPHQPSPASDVRSGPQVVAFHVMDNRTAGAAWWAPVIAPGAPAHLGEQQTLSIRHRCLA